MPTPNTNGVINIDSAPNFNLFNILLPASSLPSLSRLSIAVGPSKKSPNVPISSTSATSVSPVAPPNTPAANLLVVPGSNPNLSSTLKFNFLALFAPSWTALDFKLAYVPAFFALIALSANLVASLKPTPPGIPICVNTSTSLPTVLSCAVSSKIFMSSKNLSISATLLESAPRSMSSAPRDTTPSTVLINPDARPAPIDVYQAAELFSSDGINGTNFAI